MIDFIFEFSLLGLLEAFCFAFILLYVFNRTGVSSLILDIVSGYLKQTRTFSIIKEKNGRNFLPFILSKDSRINIVANQSGTQDLLRFMQHGGRKPHSSFLDWGIHFPFLAQCVRLKKFNYIQVSDNVFNDSRLKCSIKQAAEDILKENKKNSEDISENPDPVILDENASYQKILKTQEKRAYKVLMNMRSKISDTLLRVTSWLLYKLLPCFLSGVVTHTKQIEVLKAASENAPGVPLIFLPLHRSHLDYIMVSFILLNNDIRSPIVAAGNNLQIPFFGALLRGLGAFFIKRKIDPVLGQKDTIYRAVLHLYMQHALKAGHNVEFFIEGGRTRTGKPCMPKNGILSVIVNAFMDGTIADALLVPVSVNYERLVDGNFVLEQLGQKKEPETFRSAVAGIWKVLNSKYGLMRIDFHEPFSIRQLVQTFNKIAQQEGSDKLYKPAERRLQHNQSSSSLYGTDIVCEEHRSLVDSISRHVVYDCAAATCVMTTNAVAFLLLTRFRDGVLETDLAEELDNLRKKLMGQKDLGFSGDSLHIIKYACDLLGSSLVVKEDKTGQTFLKPNIKLPEVIELAYYSNTLTPHFALESIVLTASHVLNEKEGQGNYGISRKKLKEMCFEHCEILRNEFIFCRPTQNLDLLIETTIDALVNKNFLSLPKLESSETVRRTQNIAKYFDNSDSDNEDIGFYNTEIDIKVFLTSENMTEQISLLNVLAPYGYAYLTVALALKNLIGNAMLDLDFIKICTNDIKQCVQSGDCPFGESISTDSIKNSIKLFEKWSVIAVCNQYGVRLLSLANLYDSLDGVQSVVDRVKNIIPPS